MQNYNQHSIIFIPWIMYGTSKYINTPPGSVLDNFRCHENKYYGTGKSIINLNKINTINCVHKINKDEPIYIFDKNTKLYELPIHINHYFTKSFKQYIKKKMSYGLGQTNFFNRTPLEIIGPVISECFNININNHIMEKYVNKINLILNYTSNNNQLDYATYYDIIEYDNKFINMKYLLTNKLNIDENFMNQLINSDNIKYVKKNEFKVKYSNIDYSNLNIT
jgi:hypothetical protein